MTRLVVPDGIHGPYCERCCTPTVLSDSLAGNPTVFLGAGASMDSGLPGSKELFKLVIQDIMKLPPDGPDGGARELLRRLVSDFDERGGQPDIEILLTATHVIGKTIPSLVGLRALFREKYQSGQFVIEARRLATIICDRVVHHLRTPPSQKVRYLEQLLPLRPDRKRPLEVFTLNYDLCLETALRDANAWCATGVDPWGNPKAVDASELDVRLFKLHGSLDWKRGKEPLIVLGFQEKVGLISPYWSQWNAFVESLEHLDVVVIIGYGFGDEHVNSTLQEAVARGSKLVVVQPDFYSVDRWTSRLGERFSQIYPLFMNAEEALLGRHIIHVLQFLHKFERSLSLFGVRDRGSHEYLKQKYSDQVGEVPEFARGSTSDA